MPVPVKLGVSFTQAEIDAMKAGIQVVVDTINAKIYLNLNTDERESLAKVGNERFPFVARSIGQYADDYPAFNPIAYKEADAKLDLKTYVDIDGVMSKLKEATEVSTELQMVAGHFAFEFMSEQYAAAKRNKKLNVQGAQVIYDGLKECFEGQGNFGDETPADDTPPTP